MREILIICLLMFSVSAFAIGVNLSPDWDTYTEKITDEFTADAAAVPERPSTVSGDDHALIASTIGSDYLSEDTTDCRDAAACNGAIVPLEVGWRS